MNRRPLVAIACCCIIGASFGSLFQDRAAIMALIALIFVLLGLSLLGKVGPKLAILCGIALFLLHSERQWVEQRNISDLTVSGATVNSEVELQGRLTTVAEVDGDLVSFRLKATAIQIGNAAVEKKISDTVIIRIKLNKQEEQVIAASWRRGDHVIVKGVIELPGEASNFGAFDYRNYLKKQGIHWQLSTKGLDSVTHTNHSIPTLMKPLRVLDDLRDAIGGIMDRLYTDEDSGYMKGLVVGIRSDLDPEQFDNFARIGLTHVLAISGLHVGVVVYLLLQIGAVLRLTRERTLDMTIAMMPVYMMITGASPSAVRACLMAMLALWLARRNALKDGLHLLLAAAMLMLLWNPSLIEDVSFQLSFIVTAGLILFVPTITESLPIPWKWLKGPLAVALTAQLVSFPVSIYYFHAVHLLSLPANFVLVPFISFVVMPLGMASIALGAIWIPLGIIPAKLATWGNQLTFSVVNGLNGFVELRMVWPQPSLLWVVCAYLLMGIGIVGLKRRLTRKIEREWWTKQASAGRGDSPFENTTMPLSIQGDYPNASGRDRLLIMSISRRLLYLILFFGWLLWGYQPMWMDRSATISFINVGQGDCILIRTGQGKHILIDAGGTVSFSKPGEEWRARSDPYEVGRKLLVPLLLKRGIGEIDVLVLSHLDNDHIGGAQAILGNIPVRSLFFNGTIKDSPGVLSLLRQVTDKSTTAYEVHSPMEWEVDDSTTIQVLYPTAQQMNVDNTIEVQNEQNELSIVLLVTIYGRSFLLPGDLEVNGEREVVEAERSNGRQGIDGSRHIDVLKAGHHGSKTSTTQVWVNYWLPQETVISVGLNNFYGHPNRDVLDRLAEADSHVWRTDLHGEIQYRVDQRGTMERRVMRLEQQEYRK
ncbi:ComEC/Rec2 family competence protein [Cohnella sp. WQ 127256]|uniref:ComEC/Rec2 family competence protein n=1 Tax=Cohnella sp. WQ 127256 TaxID=2938790 RepID=UPI0021198742|nr:ComEC/Rec2 family competence protein [Cohnella sp. WQ 127256]